MARPLRIEYPGAFYHVMNRGLERRKIYQDPKEYEKFLRVLLKAERKYAVVLHAYCLMPNHYHLLLETPNGRLNQAMRHLDGVYTQYFNRKNKRVGPLLQGRYKAVLVDAESYLLEVSRYIHMNPVEAGLIERPERYPRSSMGVYTRKRVPEEWLTTQWLLSRVSANEMQARRKLFSFTVARSAKEWDPFKAALGGYLLGSEKFIQKVKGEKVPLRREGSISRLREVQKHQDVEGLRARIARITKDERLAERLLAYHLRKNTPMRLREIGEVTGGAGIHAVCKKVFRFEKEAQERKDYRDAIRELEKTVNV